MKKINRIGIFLALVGLLSCGGGGQLANPDNYFASFSLSADYPKTVSNQGDIVLKAQVSAENPDQSFSYNWQQVPPVAGYNLNCPELIPADTPLTTAEITLTLPEDDNETFVCTLELELNVTSNANETKQEFIRLNILEDHENAIFVDIDKGKNSGRDGSIDEPLGTLGYALQVAEGKGSADIYLTRSDKNHYTLEKPEDVLRSSVSIYGGYTIDANGDWVRHGDASVYSVISSVTGESEDNFRRGIVKGEKVSGMILDGIMIQTKDFTTSSPDLDSNIALSLIEASNIRVRNSYIQSGSAEVTFLTTVSSMAVFIKKSVGVFFQNSQIYSGDGSDGADGGGLTGTAKKGETGKPGEEGHCSSTDGGGGGLGGVMPGAHISFSGGNGGYGGRTYLTGEKGGPGYGPGGGQYRSVARSSWADVVEKGTTILDGLVGRDAQTPYNEYDQWGQWLGLGGEQGPPGRFSHSGYVPGRGNSGTKGWPGEGGSGGAGSPAPPGTENEPLNVLPGGGGGGSGGYGGAPGSGGHGGGASIGVFIVDSTTIRFDSSVYINIGKGGKGGNGGRGQAGGEGGDGGAGGKMAQNSNCITQSWVRGGNGAKGGRGGQGGHGAGGGGGDTIGVFYDETSSEVLPPPGANISLGEPGEGGVSGKSENDRLTGFSGRVGRKLEVFTSELSD